jgi:hypothetical protein
VATGRRRWPIAVAVPLALAAAAGLLPQRAVVTVTGADGRPVAARVLPAPGRFELRYRHSYYQAEAAESFVAGPDGSFRLVAVGSPSQAVLDYYGLAGRTHREGGWVRLELRQPQRFERLPLVATGLGRRTLVVGGRAVPLASPGGEPAHLVITVERRPWLLTLVATQDAGPRQSRQTTVRSSARSPARWAITSWTTSRVTS